jgi:hypothetical protein
VAATKFSRATADAFHRFGQEPSWALVQAIVGTVGAAIVVYTRW